MMAVALAESFGMRMDDFQRQLREAGVPVSAA